MEERSVAYLALRQLMRSRGWRDMDAVTEILTADDGAITAAYDYTTGTWRVTCTDPYAADAELVTVTVGPGGTLKTAQLIMENLRVLAGVRAR